MQATEQKNPSVPRPALWLALYIPERCGQVWQARDSRLWTQAWVMGRSHIEYASPLAREQGLVPGLPRALSQTLVPGLVWCEPRRDWQQRPLRQMEALLQAWDLPWWRRGADTWLVDLSSLSRFQQPEAQAKTLMKAFAEASGIVASAVVSSDWRVALRQVRQQEAGRLLVDQSLPTSPLHQHTQGRGWRLNLRWGRPVSARPLQKKLPLVLAQRIARYLRQQNCEATQLSLIFLTQGGTCLRLSQAVESPLVYERALRPWLRTLLAQLPERQGFTQVRVELSTQVGPGDVFQASPSERDLYRRIDKLVGPAGLPLVFPARLLSRPVRVYR